MATSTQTPPDDMPHAVKVEAYITWGSKLLVFDQPAAPDVLPQTPGGTVDPGEVLDEAVVREVFEESGLAPDMFETITFLGDYVTRGWDRYTHRHAYHFVIPATTPMPDTWDHWEEHRNDGGPPVLFRYRWVPRNNPPAMVPRHAELVHLIFD